MVVLQRDFPELVARAEQIVVGTVTEMREQPDDAGTPMTYVTFADLTVLKGTAGDTLTLRFYGGAAARVPDMPTFNVGERAVLFVAGNGRDVCPLVGVWQGRFRVQYDDARHAEVVADNDHAPVTGRAGRALLHAADTGAPAVTLDEFRQLVADELAHPTGPAQ